MQKNSIRVLLYLASNSPFYTNLYPSIKRGFEEAGCIVEGGANLLKDDELIEKIDIFKPDFVFEMNRVKSEIKNFPKDAIHICWLVDFWGRLHHELKGSDILYVWAEDWVRHFKKSGIKSVYHLAPATDKDIYKPIECEKKYDFCFLGHISAKWSDDELYRVVGMMGDKELLFKDLLPYIQEYVLTQTNDKSFLDSLEYKNIVLDKPIEKTLLYDISNRTSRQVRRERYIDIFKGCNLAIYGSKNWRVYDKYSKYYRGYIEQPSEINKAINYSNILLHDGSYPHFRTFDAMASGVVVVAAQPPSNFDNPWYGLGFIDTQDYINVDIYSGKIDMQQFKDEKLLQDISKRARQKVLKEHLWVNRAQQVIDDVIELKGQADDKK